jgi:phosphatidylinositol alpha 1,6-mannosyltransferase
MEAMACGLCVIAANAYALPELVHHEENGLLFQPGDSDEFAQKIDQLLSDGDRRARMGEKSLKIIADHDRIKVLNEWEEIYNRLAIEFKENKERREYIRTAHKYQSYKTRKSSKVTKTKVAKVAKVQHSRKRLNGRRDK